MHNVVALLQNVVSIHSTQLSVYKPKNKMNKKNINELIASLLEAIAQEVHSEETSKAQDKLIIKGLNISYDELIKRPDAQEALIRLHNEMSDRLEALADRVEELEANS